MDIRDLSQDTELLLKVLNLLVIFYPMMACAYSKAIFDCRPFSVPLNRNSGSGSRISPNQSVRDVSRDSRIEMPEFGLVEMEIPAE